MKHCGQDPQSYSPVVLDPARVCSTAGSSATLGVPSDPEALCPSPGAQRLSCRRQASAACSERAADICWLPLPYSATCSSSHQPQWMLSPLARTPHCAPPGNTVVPVFGVQPPTEPWQLVSRAKSYRCLTYCSKRES